MNASWDTVLCAAITIQLDMISLKERRELAVIYVTHDPLRMAISTLTLPALTKITVIGSVFLRQVSKKVPYACPTLRSSWTAENRGSPSTLRWGLLKMPDFLLQFLVSVLAACVLSSLALAEKIPTIATTKEDPFTSCSLLTKNLPNDIHKIRAIAKLHKEKIETCTEYAGDPPEKCTAHLLTFSGLELIVLSVEPKAVPIEATISNSRWNLLGDIRVGQKVEVLEKYFGVKLPRNTSPVELIGECAPLVVWHSGNRVTKISLPCHACD
ncbi:MAG TPA: hypothetical protein PLU16_15370 [Gallionellaceae bacterium]|nr:hypothetical protein [Gallionellaceae bacterium]